MRRSPRQRARSGARAHAALAVLAALAAAAGAALAAQAQASGAAAPSSAWREGAAGYRQAAAEALQLGRPLLVYFRTDWCPYCRELERTLLANGEVEAYLRQLARARVNPEAGADEERLAQAYGVDGYPALFVQGEPGAPPARVSRTVRGPHGETQLKTPQQFVATLRRASRDR
jgi:thiol:disulfide interchange protein